MKILCVGDSIIKGEYGENFVSRMQGQLPQTKFVNKGINGATLNKIAYTLLEEIENRPYYDIIILLAGANDIVMPTYPNRGPLYKFAYRHQQKKGFHPITSISKFEQFYTDLLLELKRKCRAKIILATLGPLDELAGSITNQQRLAYNDCIRNIALQQRCCLADAGAICDEETASLPQRSYLLGNFWNLLLFDRFIGIFKKGNDWLSRKRRLHLTIDGVHLNGKGAQVFADTILDCILEIRKRAIMGRKKDYANWTR